jgi:uncharacterized protein
MPRVIHFEIHAEDPQRALKFYSGLLGWEFTKWEGPMEYWVVKTGPDGQPGINGGMLRRQGAGPLDGQGVNAYVCTVDIDSVDRLCAAIPKQGGQVVVPKMPIPGLGWLAYAKDTEGNIFGFMQMDPAAK